MGYSDAMARRPPLIFLAALVACAAVVGCNAIFGIEVIEGDATTTNGGRGGDGAEGGGSVTSTGAGGTGAGTQQGGGGEGGCVDSDGDGVTNCDDDCDDTDEGRFPGNEEVCDGKDQDCDDVPDNGCMVDAYVSALRGDNDNPGTAEYPVKTIEQGILFASNIDDVTQVTVGEGTYGEQVEIAAGIDIVGGHRCNANTCDWQYDPAAHSSILNSTELPIVTADGGVDRATVLDGFFIVGGILMDAPVGVHATVDLSGAAPTLTNNHITGPQVMCASFCGAAGVKVATPGADGGPLLQENHIDAGVCDEASAGVSLQATASIVDNNIFGGEARFPSAVRAALVGNAGAPLTLRDNDLAGGDCTGSDPVGNTISLTTAAATESVVIDGNRINVQNTPTCMGCAPGESCGGITIDGGNAIITNNVVLGIADAQFSHAIYVNDGEDGGVRGDIVIHSNTLWGNGTREVSVGIRMNLLSGLDGSMGRIRNNIIDAGDALLNFGIYEVPTPGAQIEPELVHNNKFIATSGMWVHWDGGAAVTDFTADDVNMNNPNAVGNIDTECSLDATFHISAGSNCEGAGSAVEAPVTDYEGDVRPQGTGYDIGADEADS